VCYIKLTRICYRCRYGQATPPSPPPVFSVITAGMYFTCGKAQQNSPVICWGFHQHTQWDPPAEMYFTQLAAGETHLCAVANPKTQGIGSKAVTCRGEKMCGSCPNTIVPIVSCVDTSRLNAKFAQQIREVVSGPNFSCGYDNLYKIKCWGCHVLTQNIPDIQVNQITLGDSHACAMTREDKIVCWGSNKYGQSTPPKDEQVPDVAPLPDIAPLSHTI
jgi:alpha-tubulin suppressor-like RCC1 family protein